MSVKGSREGLSKDNSINKKVEPLITVEKLKNIYLKGLNMKDPNTGEEFDNETYQQYIDNAVSMVEHDLDISIIQKVGEVEYRDYNFNDYYDWGYIALNNYPIIEVESMEMVYFKDNDETDVSVQTIPDSWIRLQAHDGIIRLIPNSKFAANLQISETGSFFPLILKTNMVPHLWKITYSHGFCDGGIPILINVAIAYLAAIQALITGGNLIIGAGIASSSLGLDGLSQSISTTQSAENSGFSATILDYKKLLFGQNQEDAKNSIMHKLRMFYKGETIGMI